MQQVVQLAAVQPAANGPLQLVGGMPAQQRGQLLHIAAHKGSGGYQPARSSLYGLGFFCLHHPLHGHRHHLRRLIFLTIGRLHSPNTLVL